MRISKKQHRCDVCNGLIQKGESYLMVRRYNNHEGVFFTYDIKECSRCIINKPKRNYKLLQHMIRSEKRKANCPDADFKYVYQGGWDSALGCPDGGDVRSECSGCNLYCCR